MGIFRLKKHSVLIPLLSFVLLTGCEAIVKKTLTVETVRNTFDIVDDSLDHLDVDSNDYQTNFGAGYTDIYEQFTGQDYVGTYPRDFNYDDEPFLQFRYVKGILDNKGDSFNFGTKYTEIVYLPCVPDEKNWLSARGIYVNFLETSRAVFVPQYGLPQDQEALALIRAHTDKPVAGVDCGEVAAYGGALHCLSKEYLF